ncbi:hypothetical protein A3J56_00450 [Candidatus Giovannonibacteria bacterium RIFCSPHIGHO2_02_FULL_46_20]|uniref:Uncharacterized protein n=1 Tax=Candidatus Giovannonibacteria bacterium RIFCSPHIGHO2_02_FULL_46_20 TaxID=1798338 RepID=A0A1F5WDX0_9BACT|nr:MAG: hypothetical protein A3J56_00450 [Candidatus Giovannonibacteria bacterium RIFCSPHIGHO2_02_FULL_46_20]
MYSTNVFASGGKTKFTKRQIAGIVVVCVILIGFMIGKIFFRPSPAEVQEQTAEVIKQGDIAKCDSFDGKIIEGVDYGTVCRNNVSINLATQNLDPSYCDKLDETMMNINDCKRTVIQKKVQETKDVATCDLWSDQSERSACINFYWRSKAVQSDNTTFCDNATDNDAKTLCIDDVFVERLISKSDSVQCTSFPTTLRNDCVAYKEAQTKQTKTVSQQCAYTHPLLVSRFCSFAF